MEINFNNTDLFKLEDKFDLPIPAILNLISKGNFKLKELYILFWVGSHSEKSFDEFSNEHKFDELTKLMPKMSEAITSSLSTGEKKK